MTKYLSKDEILESHDLVTEDVDVPEWGGTVRIRTMTGAERDGFEASMLGKEGEQQKMDYTNLRARLVSLTAVDERDVRMFEEKDVAFLGLKSAAALNRCFAVAQRLNGLSKEAVDSMAKNSATVPNEGSTSA